jgi:O-antigen/teichoic acid export membrane protein
MLTQKLVLSYSTKIAIQFIQMVASFIVARIVGPGVMGTIAYGLAYVSIFLFISDLVHIKFISER